VAHRFVTRRLAEEPLRGLLSRDRLVLDQFEPLVRYGPIDPGALAA
jgi:acyl-CoA dehydrogenase